MVSIFPFLSVITNPEKFLQTNVLIKNFLNYFEINSNNQITLIGDSSLSKRDFSRITKPLEMFGANIKYHNTNLPVKIRGSEFLRPIEYSEKLGSAQCKSAVMLAALKTPGITKIVAKKSRNHTELLFKSLKIF